MHPVAQNVSHGSEVDRLSILPLLILTLLLALVLFLLILILLVLILLIVLLLPLVLLRILPLLIAAFLQRGQHLFRLLGSRFKVIGSIICDHHQRGVPHGNDLMR